MRSYTSLKRPRWDNISWSQALDALSSTDDLVLPHSGQRHCRVASHAVELTDEDSAFLAGDCFIKWPALLVAHIKVSLTLRVCSWCSAVDHAQVEHSSTLSRSLCGSIVIGQLWGNSSEPRLAVEQHPYLFLECRPGILSHLTSGMAFAALTSIFSLRAGDSIGNAGFLQAQESGVLFGIVDALAGKATSSEEFVSTKTSQKPEAAILLIGQSSKVCQCLLHACTSFQ